MMVYHVKCWNRSCLSGLSVHKGRKCGLLANKLYFLLPRKSVYKWLLISTDSSHSFTCGFTTAHAQKSTVFICPCVSTTDDITALLVFSSALSDIQFSVVCTGKYSLDIRYNSSTLLQSASVIPEDITRGSTSANSANSTGHHSHHASKVINLMQ